MKRVVVVFSFVVAVVLLFSGPAVAQQRPGQRADTMRGPGMGMMHAGMMQMMHRMHQQMSQSPIARATMMAFMLPALADTLELSDQQVDQLRSLRDSMMAQQKQYQQQMMEREQTLQSQFQGEDLPSADSLRKELMAMTDRWVDQRVSVYDTAQQMREVLTAEQREMLDGMTSQQQMQQMMSHMPMMDMMQMMRSMHGGMMGLGMMAGYGPMRGQMMQQRRMQENVPRR